MNRRDFFRAAAAAACAPLLPATDPESIRVVRHELGHMLGTEHAPFNFYTQKVMGCCIVDAGTLERIAKLDFK